MHPHFFQPAIYEHAAAAIGQTPWAVSRSLELLVKAHAAAYDRYQHTPITVGIDIYNLEAEAYGATIPQPDANDLPSISKPLLDSLEQILEITAYNPRRDGRLAMVIKAGQELQKLYPQSDIRVPVSGPFSIASILLGFENLLMAAIESPRGLGQALARLAEHQIAFVKAIQEAGLQVTIFESAATPPLISPAQFRDLEAGPLRNLVQTTQKLIGRPPSLIMGGDTAPLAADLADTGASYLICPAETDQALFMEKIAAYPEIMVRINMHSRVVAFGTPAELLAEVVRVLNLAKGRDKVCLGTGVLPYETPMDRVAFIRELLTQHA